jgi:uncharacterized protein involved in outer membrane biogenesis
VKKPLKVLLVVTLVVGVALGVGAVLLVKLVDPEQFRARLQAVASERLGRDVRFGTLGVSLWPGLGLAVEDLVVAGVSATEPLVAAPRVRVAANPIPLLSGELEIVGVLVEQPTLRLARNAEGRWNVLELLGAAGGGAGGGKVTVDALEVRDGRVLLADAFAKRGEVLRHDLHHVDARVGGLSRREGPRDVAVRAELPSAGGGAVSFDGVVGPGNAVSGHVVATDVDVARLSPYLAAGTGLAVSAGQVSADVRGRRDASGAAEGEGTVTVRGLRLDRALRGSRPLDASLAFEASMDERGAVDVSRLSLSTGTTTLSLSGSVREAEGEQLGVLELDEAVVQPRDVLSAAAALGVALPEVVDPDVPVRAGGKARIRRAGGPEPRHREVREIALDGVRLSGARVAARRTSEGRLVVGKAAPAAEPGAGLPRIVARDVRIADVGVTLTDESLAGGPATLDLRDVTATIGAWAPGRPADVALEARGAGGTLRARGTVGGAERGQSAPASLELELADLSLEALAPWLSALGGVAARRGTLTATCRLAGSLETGLGLVGRVRLGGAVIGAAGREVGPVDLELEHDVLVSGGGQRIELRSASLKLPSSVVTVDGRVDRPADGPATFDVGSSRPVLLPVEDLRYLTRLFAVALPFDLDAEEPLSLSGRVRKARGELSVDGSARLRKVVVRHRLLAEPLRVAAADVELDGEHVIVRDAALRLGATDLAGSLQLAGFTDHRVRFDLASQQADLDELFGFLSKARADEAPAPAAPAGPDHLARTTASGTLRVGRATLGGLVLERFSGSVALAERVLTLDPVGVELYGGRGEGRVRVDLGRSPPAFVAHADLRDVDAKALLLAGVGYGDLEGRATAALDLRGTATSVPEALRSLEGSGTLTLADGAFRGLNMLLVLEDAAVFGERTVADLGRKLAQEGTTFQRLEAQHEIREGVLHLRSVRTTTPEGDMSAKGTAGLLDQRLRVDMAVLFTEDLSRRLREEGSRAADVFWDDRKARVLLPLVLVGTLAQPRADIDWSEAAGRLLEREAGRQLGDVLGDLLGGGRGGGSTRGGSGGSTSGGTGSAPPSADSAGAATPREEAPSTATPPAAPPPAVVPPGAPVVEGLSVRFSGNVLAPDLKVKATLRGRDLSHGVIVVRETGGRELARVATAFQAQVEEHYATVPRDADTAVAVSKSISGEKLLGARGLTVEVTPWTRSGLAGPTLTASTERRGLF